MKKFSSVLKFTARGTFADGTDVTKISPEALGAALKAKLGLNNK